MLSRDNFFVFLSGDSDHTLNCSKGLLYSVTVVITLLFFSTSGFASDSEHRENKVLFGADGRSEIYTASPELKAVSSAVSAVVKKTQLESLPLNRWKFTESKTGLDKNWCPDERFLDQPTNAFCTAFLIDQRHVVTSAHCVRPTANQYRPGASCNEVAFVFGYEVSTDNHAPAAYLSEQVFACESVERESFDPVGADWSVIRLDKDVKGFKPLTLAKSTKVEVGQALTTIGHPAGLPKKIASGATVLELSNAGFFRADLDTYEGNSGSPVLAVKDDQYQVVGILSRGNIDYVEISAEEAGKSCKLSKVCDVNECGGEQVTLIGELGSFAR